MALARDESNPRLLADGPLSWRLYAAVISVYGLLFYGFFELGASFSWVYEGSLWYPAAGLRWALLLASGWRFLPGIVLVEVLAISLYGYLHPQTYYYDSWWVLLVALTPLLYAIATAWFVHVVPLDTELRRTRDVVRFGVGSVLVTLMVAVAGRIVFYALGRTIWGTCCRRL